jgi:hypothetical protein
MTDTAETARIFTNLLNKQVPTKDQ